MSAGLSNREWIGTLTTDQVMTGISRAIQARDWLAVEGLMKILAVKDPRKAQAVYDVMVIATGADTGEDAATAVGGE